MKSTTAINARPQPGDYVPYYEKYVSLVPDQDILATLEKQLTETVRLLSARAEDKGDLRYAPGKWSVKEVLGHVIDTERIFSYRAHRPARLLRNHLVENTLRAVENADEVQADDLLPEVGRRFGEVLQLFPADVVHQHVH